MAERKSSFESLECWKAGRELKLFIRREIRPSLPNDERYDLADQMRRAARSITANIAEGYGRYHYLDEAKFLSNARGSAHEVLDHLIEAFDEGYIGETQLIDGRAQIDELLRLTNGYRAYVLKRASEGK
ncbi:MAG: four helix bundle protein [Verrucomicrobia bacterium]|jgi:four helix bundle protein|nr:four helix bundle protein [Verrucomicrobiota bacterium]